MKRNSGLIGRQVIANGTRISDTFDQYNARRSNTWPVPAIFVSVTPNVSSVNEGGTVVFNVVTDGVPNQTLFFNVIGTVSASDFTSGSLTGSFLLSNGTGTFSLTLLNDTVTEGTETFQVQIRTGSTSGPTQLLSSTVTVNDTSLTPTATVTPNFSSKNEDGSGVTFTVNTTNFTSGTLYYTVLSVSGSVNSFDFTPAAATGSFNISGSTGTITLNIAADATTEGTESFQVQVRTISTSGTVIGTSSTVTINDTSLAPVQPGYVTLGSKAPTFNAGASSVHPPAGWTSLQNSSVDDNFVSFTSPFSITINGTAYTTHFMGSNTYITWGTGRTEYNGLSASNPPQNKLMMGASDNSYQRVSTFTSGTSYTRVRYEGNGSASGTVGSPGIVLEITFFNPANYGGVPVIEVLGGLHNRLGGISGIATTSAFMLSWTTAANSAYVLVGNATGTAWTRYLGFVNNSGY